MVNGDLRAYLVNEQTTRSWTLEKVQIAIDITEALVCLHSFYPPIVHRDFKSRNVLLNSEMRAKLSDFGAFRHESEQNTMTVGVGTDCWLAPKVISGSLNYESAVDIFSFDVVLSKLDSHRLPYENARGLNGRKLADVTLLQLVSAGELRPSFLPSCPAEIAKLGDLCLFLLRETRPTVVEVAYALRASKMEMGGSP